MGGGRWQKKDATMLSYQFKVGFYMIQHSLVCHLLLFSKVLRKLVVTVAGCFFDVSVGE